jgi:hypothetical protein
MMFPSPETHTERLRPHALRFDATPLRLRRTCRERPLPEQGGHTMNSHKVSGIRICFAIQASKKLASKWHENWPPGTIRTGSSLYFPKKRMERDRSFESRGTNSKATTGQYYVYVSPRRALRGIGMGGRVRLKWNSKSRPALWCIVRSRRIIVQDLIGEKSGTKLASESVPQGRKTKFELVFKNPDRHPHKPTDITR